MRAERRRGGSGLGRRAHEHERGGEGVGRPGAPRSGRVGPRRGRARRRRSGRCPRQRPGGPEREVAGAGASASKNPPAPRAGRSKKMPRRAETDAGARLPARADADEHRGLAARRVDSGEDDIPREADDRARAALGVGALLGGLNCLAVQRDGIEACVLLCELVWGVRGVASAFAEGICRGSAGRGGMRSPPAGSGGCVRTRRMYWSARSRTRSPVGRGGGAGEAPQGRGSCAFCANTRKRGARARAGRGRAFHRRDLGGVGRAPSRGQALARDGDALREGLNRHRLRSSAEKRKRNVSKEPAGACTPRAMREIRCARASAAASRALHLSC